MRFDTYLKVKQLANAFNTYDPFKLADLLGFRTVIRDIGSQQGFCTNMLGFTDIVISQNIIDTPEKWPVMAHELAHGVEHEDCAAWYSVGVSQQNSMEYQANMFASYELSKLYEEQFDCLPEDFKTLQMAYALPDDFYWFFNSSDILSL